ncbi:MAG: VWA domain-containing protein [Planctomycetota bacterium]
MRGGRRRRPGASLLALGLALAVVAAIASAVGTPLERSDGSSAPPVHAVLVDVSASVTRTRPGWRRGAVQTLVRAARRADEAGHEVALVTFARGVERRWGPGPAAEFIELIRDGRAASWLDAPVEPGASGDAAERDLGSNLEGAARLAVEVLSSEGRAPGTITVLGDGTATGPDPSSRLLDPIVGALHLVRPEPQALTDLAAAGVFAPRVAEPGARIPVRVEVAVTGPDLIPSERGDVVLEWELRVTSAEASVASGTRRGRESADVPPGARLRGQAPDGERRFAVDVELPPLPQGSAMLDVRVLSGAAIDAGASDSIRENDVASTRFRIGDPVRALVVVRDEASVSARDSFSGPAFDGLELTTIPAAALARELASADDIDAIVTLDLPFIGLPAAELTRFVNRGGGWLHCNGLSLLRADAPDVAALAALEPDREPREPRDIVFFVDGSGSMEGQRWTRVRSALGDLVPSIGASDRLELRFFTQIMGATELVFEAASDGMFGREESARRVEAVRDLMRARVPGGATDIVGSLMQLADVRGAPEHWKERTQGRSGLCILITDGLTDSVTGLRGEVRERLATYGDRLVIIQVGDDPVGTRFLTGLLAEGEEIVRAGELEDLGNILQQTVQDVEFVSDARVVAGSAPIAEPWAQDLRSAVVDAAGLAQPMRIDRSLRCKAAEGAASLFDLEADRGVLAAVAARGEGTVCGVAMPRLGRGPSAWNPGLRRRCGWVAPLLRAMARRRDEAPAVVGVPRPRAALENDGAQLVVRGLPDGLPPRVEATLRAGPEPGPFGTLLPGTALATLDLSVPSTGRSVGAVREAPRPGVLDRVGQGTALQLDLQTPDGGASWALPLSSDGSSEIRPALGPGSREVRAFAVAASRRADAAEPDGPDPARGPQPLTPWLLALALAALLVGAIGRLPR